MVVDRKIKQKVLYYVWCSDRCQMLRTQAICRPSSQQNSRKRKSSNTNFRSQLDLFPSPFNSIDISYFFLSLKLSEQSFAEYYNIFFDFCCLC